MVGAGGIGAHLAQALHRQSLSVIGVDGDKVSPSNIDRQLFTADHIGLPKVEVLAERGWLTHSVFRYLAVDTVFWDNLDAFIPRGAPVIVLGAVDNMAARRTLVQLTDWLVQSRNRVVTLVMGGNETDDAEAVAYAPGLTPKHPYVLIPEMETSNDGHDPLRSCTAGPASQQTYLANLTAAVLTLQLANVWSSLPGIKSGLTPTEWTLLVGRLPQRIVWQKGLFLHTPERVTVSHDYPD
jgi:hypothetical protein